MNRQHFLPFNIELSRIAQGYKFVVYTYNDYYLGTIDMKNLNYFKDMTTLTKFIGQPHNSHYLTATV